MNPSSNSHFFNWHTPIQFQLQMAFYYGKLVKGNRIKWLPFLTKNPLLKLSFPRPFAPSFIPFHYFHTGYHNGYATDLPYPFAPDEQISTADDALQNCCGPSQSPAFHFLWCINKQPLHYRLSNGPYPPTLSYILFPRTSMSHALSCGNNPSISMKSRG